MRRGSSGKSWRTRFLQRFRERRPAKPPTPAPCDNVLQRAPIAASASYGVLRARRAHKNTPVRVKNPTCHAPRAQRAVSGRAPKQNAPSRSANRGSNGRTMSLNACQTAPIAARGLKGMSQAHRAHKNTPVHVKNPPCRAPASATGRFGRGHETERAMPKRHPRDEQPRHVPGRAQNRPHRRGGPRHGTTGASRPKKHPCTR